MGGAVTTLDFLLSKAPPGPHKRNPIEIPNVGRQTLAKWFHDLGFTTGAEVGVEQGGYAEILCRENPGLRLTCVDAWRAYPGYRDHVTQAKLDGFFRATQERLARFAPVYIREWSVDAARHVPDGSLDFIFLDSNHRLEHVIADLTAWSPKVRSGGIVAGHDYCKRKQSGYHSHVVEAVQAYTEAWRIRPWFVLGRKETRPGEIRDKARSFAWVKL